MHIAPPQDPPKPGPGQESVWDYPRPPALERCAANLRVVFGGEEIANTDAGMRICETASPATYYFPPQDVALEFMTPTRHRSLCEWKGGARYFSLEVGDKRIDNAVWCYPEPWQPFEPIAGYLAFMAGPMDACYVGDDRVEPQPGGFYGGWITPNLLGPFKGEPGTGHW